MANLEEDKKLGDGLDDDDADFKSDALPGDSGSGDGAEELENPDSWELEEDLEE